MKNTLLKKKPELLPQPSREFCDGEIGCYVEEYFHEMLAFERKRSERSGRPFLVMTMDFSEIGRPQQRRQATKASMGVLALLTRDTDIKGWYRTAAILGVIFTEMNSRETETLRMKLSQNLRVTLPAEFSDAIQIEFHRFPEDENLDERGPRRFTFYPDVPKKNAYRKTSLAIKRSIDIVGSIAGLVIFSPFFILIPIAIKLTSRGPVLFRQERVGQFGKKFSFLKFRSMYINNNQDVHKEYVQSLICGTVSGEAAGGSENKVYKITNDRRVTPVGRLLRKTSLDELPQFFNVLKGEMSLAGPRPPIPYEIEKYAMWHRSRVMEIKPGITGLWQVEGRSSTTFDEMVRLDIQYARNWSLWLDIKILLKTPWAVVAGRGAY